MPRSGRGKKIGSKRYNTEFVPEMRQFVRWMESVRNALGTAPVCRTWLYIFEEMGWINKDEFEWAITWLSDMRKKHCLIPIHLIGKDVSRPVSSYGFVEEAATAYESFQQSMRATLDYTSYRPHDYWDYQRYFPVVWSEKLDIIKMLSSVIPAQVVHLAGKGWADINSRAQVIDLCKEAQLEKGLIPVILYLGDLDPAGVNISNNLRKNLKDLEEAMDWDGADDIRIVRVGLTEEFVDLHNLPWVDNLITASKKDLADPRHKDHNKDYVQDYIRKYGVRKCEQNAMVLCVEESKELLRRHLYNFLNVDGEKQWQNDNDEADCEMRVICDLARRGMLFLEEAGVFSPKMIAAGVQQMRLGSS